MEAEQESRTEGEMGRVTEGSKEEEATGLVSGSSLRLPCPNPVD